MANGRPGDHPLTDLIVHGYDVFPSHIRSLILELNAMDPAAFNPEDSTRRRQYHGAHSPASADWHAWAEGEKSEEAEAFLKEKLNVARRLKVRRDAAADYLVKSILQVYPEWKGSLLAMTHTNSSDFPVEELQCVRTVFDAILVSHPDNNVSGVLTIYSSPEPEIFWNSDPIKRFAPGDSPGVLAFLAQLFNEEIYILQSTWGYMPSGAKAFESHWFNHDGKPAMTKIGWKSGSSEI